MYPTRNFADVIRRELESDPHLAQLVRVEQELMARTAKKISYLQESKMIRSAISAFTIILLCFAVFQVPSGSEYAPLPSATATPPVLMPVPDSDELWAAVRQLEDRVGLLEKQPSCPCPAVSIVEAAKPQVVKSTYKARWTNHDGLSFRDHGIIKHGLDPSLSDEEMARRRDADHDAHGPGHSFATTSNCPGGVCPTSARVQPAAVVRSSNCPGGKCPTSRSVQRSGGLFGFGILGR